MPGLPTSKSLWPFSPQSIPGLALWLDAADASSVTGTSPVTAWRDKSGLGNNMSVSGTVSYASNKMTFSYGGIMTSANSTTITASVSMVFIVCQATALPNGNSMVFACPNLGGGDTSIRFYPDIQSVNNADTNDLGFTYGDDGTGQYYANGTLNGNDPVIVTTGVNIIEAVVNRSGSTLFTLSSSYSSRYFEGDIQEVIVYTGPITTEQRQQVEGYLGWKWGLQSLLPPTNPYSPYNSFQPTNISGCKLWLDAADPNSVILNDPNDPASFIVQWNDKSGNGNDMYTNSGDIFYTTSPQRSLQFVTEPTMITGNQITVNTSTSVFMVIKVTSVSDLADTLEFFDLAGGEGYFSIRYDAPTNLINADGNDLGYPGGYYVNGTLYSSSGITVPLGYNIVNTTNTTQSGDTRVSLSTTFMGRYFYGNIQEVIIYTTAITSTQRQQVQAYLSQKWNIPLSFPIVTIGNSPYNRIFQPVDIPGCAMWLDGADKSSMTFSGSSITQWNDKSGNQYHATVAAGRTAATYSTALNSVYFPESTTGYETSYPADPTAETMFVVANNASPSINNNTIIGGQLGARSLGFGYSGNGGAITGRHGYLQNEVEWLAATPNDSYTSGTIGICTGYNNAGYTYISANGAAFSAAYPINGGAFYAGTTTYLGVDTTTPAYYYVGYVMEIIFYNSVLSSSQREQVEAYLAWKWGIRSSLPPTHPGYILPSFSTTFTPKSLSNMVLWLDAADSSTITLSGSSVTQWIDKSGSGYVATPIDSAITKTMLNGTPALDFGGNRMTIPNFTWNMSFTSIMVWNAYYASQMIGLTASTDPGAAWYDYISTGNWALIFLNAATSSTDPNYVRVPPDPYAGSPAPVVPGNEWFIFSIGYTAGTTTITNYAVNGTARTANAVDPQSGTNTGAFFINGLSNGAYDYSKVGEIIHYNTSLNNSERQQVEGYLAWKWGLQNSLPDTHAYKKFRP